MNFILYNTIFEKTIFFLFIINSIILTVTNIGDIIKHIHKSNSFTKEKKFKFNIVVFYILLSVLLFYVFLSPTITSFICFIAIFIAFFHTVKAIDKNEIQKNSFLLSSTLFLIFFSKASVEISIEFFRFLPHTSKEILLVSFLCLKIIFYIFFILINLGILLSSVLDIINCLNQKKVLKFNNSKIEIDNPNPFFYTIHFFENKKGSLFSILDKFFFVILCPLYITLFFIYKLIIYIYASLVRLFTKIIIKINDFYTNFTYNVLKITKISIIVSLIITYIVVVFRKDIFSENIEKIFGLISTVIVIPVILEDINKKENK